MAPFILGVRVDAVTPMELRDALTRALEGHEQRLVVTPNPEMILEAQKDPDFQKILNGAFLSLPDGAGLAYALKALSHETLWDRHPGVDTLWLLAELCVATNQRLVLCGGGEGIAAEAAEAMRERHPALDVVGVDPGRVGTGGISREVRERLERLSPHVLAVGLGHNKQERFLIEALKDLPSVRIGIGVGGAFDMIAGHIRRAPVWMQKRGLEWMWRWHLEPQRAVRMFHATIVFPLQVVSATIREGHFWKSVRSVVQEIKRQFS